MKRFTQPLAFVLISLLWISNAMNSSSLMAQSPQISISPDTVHAWLNTCGDSTTQTLSITNNGNSPLLFNILQSGSFTEGFEDGLSKWTTTGTWGVTTASAYEGLYSVTESPGGYYSNYWSNYIVMKDSMIITNKDSAKLSFYERHFLECNYDYLYIQLSVNNGSFFNLGNLNCSSSAWTNRQYNLSGYVNNGDYIKIRFYFYSDISVTYDGVFIDKVRLDGVSNKVSWMSLPITLGIVQPGETMNLNMIFHSLLQSGLYSSSLRVQTNDPNLPVVIVPFFLHFDGYPIMGVVEDYLDYGEIMQNTSLKDTAYITNTGCDVLVVSSIYSDQPEFTPLITTFILAPGLQKAIPVEFHPTVAGIYEAGIYFESNDTIIGNSSSLFTVSGSSFAAPEINTEPDSIFISLSCGDSTTVPVTISNTGGSDLHLQLSVNTSSEGLVLYYPMDGSANDQSGNNLNGTIYGASPAPDRLNRPGKALSFDGINDYIDVPDAVFFNGNFTVTAWANESAFNVMSRLFDFGNGPANNNVLACMSNGTNGTFFGEIYLNNYSGGKIMSPASIPLNEWVHLAFVYESGQIRLYKNGQLWGSGSSYYAPQNVVRTINYIARSNWATDGYYQGSFDDFRIYNYALDETELNNVYSNQSLWLTGETMQDTLEPGVSLVTEIGINTTYLFAGSYSGQIVLSSNDPLNPTKIIPVFLTVTGQPHGEIQAGPLLLDTIMQYTVTESYFKLYNHGCDSLFIYNYFCSVPEFTIPVLVEIPYILPGDSIGIPVYFHPQDTGYFEGIITLETNDGVFNITVEGYATGAPGIGFDPQSLGINFSECDQTAILDLTITNTGLTDLNWQANTGTGAGTALEFTEYGQWVSLGNLGAMPDQGTLEFWQWTNALTNYNNSFCTNGLDYYQGNKGIRFEENQYGDYGVVFGDDNAYYSGYNITYNLTVNSWHHIAVSWDKNTNQVWTYFDGLPVVEGDYCDNWATEWTAAYIGVGWADWRWWNGKIDEFRIWNTLRSNSEIQNNMLISLSGNESGLIAYWDMNEGSGTTILDKTSNNHDGNFSGAAWIESEIPIQSFVTVSPSSGTLSSGAGTTLQVSINGEGYNSGLHLAEIGFLTNDPLHLNTTYPVSMNIEGSPVVAINPVELDFGDVMQYTSKTDSVLVINSGCAELVVSGSTPFNTVFTFPTLPLIVPPRDSAYLHIVFSPVDVANYWDILTLLTNDQPVDITLMGNSVSAPHIVLDPSYLDVWVNCNDSVMIPVTITNDGGNNLEILPGSINVSTVFGAPSPPECTPSAYNHCCGIGTYHVSLGMIDNWTYASTGAYSDYSADYQTLLSAGITYTIEIETSPDYDMDAYAWIDFNNNTVFEESELILYSQDQYMHHTATFTLPDWAVKNVPLRLRVGSDYYSADPLTSCNEPYYGEYEDYGVMIQTILGISLPQTTILPSESIVMEVWFNAENLLTGEFYPSFTLLTNDPLNPVVTVQSYMYVMGAPGFSTNLQQLDFGDVMIYTMSQIPFTITNTGCSTLEVYDAYAIDPVFKLGPLSFILEPGADTTLMIGFETYWTGFTETDLYFITNMGDQVFHGTATGIAAPNIWLDFSWIDADFFCGESFSTTYTIYNDADGTGSFHIEPATTVTRDLQMQYHFTGNTADSSGKSRDLSNNEASFVNGHTGNPEEGMYFSNGAGLSYNNTTDMTSMLYPDGLSVSLWTLINYDYASQDPTPCLINVGGSPVDSAGLRIYLENDSVKARVVVDSIAYTVGTPIIWDEYFMVSATFDWYNLHLFINGNYVGEVYTEGSLMLDPDYNKVGIGYNNSVAGDEHFFTGTIDEVSIFNRSLWWEELIMIYDHYTRYSEIQFDPSSGSIDPYSTQGLTINITTDSATTGEYINFYHLVSNDPDQPRQLFAVNTFIDGWPNIVINTPEVQFDSTFQYTQVVDSVLIENPSCSILYIWYMYTDSPNFYPLSSYLDMNETIEIAPHSSRYVYVAFNPQEAGYLTDNLHIGNDVNGESIVPLSGYGKEVPIISVDPATINTYLSCVNSRVEYLNISNTGLAELTFTLEFDQVVDWMTTSTFNGVVAPGETISIELYFDRGSLPLALYTNLIKIFSNDPYHGYYEVPVFMLIPNPLVGVDLGGDTTYCEGSSTVLYGGNYANYLWNDGSTGSTLTVNSPGTYWVDVVDLYDCPSSDTIVVSSIAYPVVTTIPDTTLCSNGSVQLDAIILNTIPPQQIQAVIGNGTAYSTETGPNPFGTYYMDHRVQLLYKSSELLAAGITAGNITALGFVLNGVGNPGMNGMNIKVGTTNLNSLNGFVSGLTNVYSVSYYYPHIGQNVFTLPLPFFWNGSSNLIVEVCFDNNSWSSNSSYQYTVVSGGVWGNYCDNCNSGCNLSGGSSNANRANLVIYGDGDKSRYQWTGPAAYQALFRNPVVSNIQTNQTGWYHLAVNNGFGCYGYDSTYITVLPSPAANAGPDLNILGYDSTLISASVSSGIPPYTFAWTPITDLNDPTLLQPMAKPLSTRTYTLTINGDNGCSHSDQVIINVTPRFSISGQVIYNNAYYSALPGVKVRLKNAAQIPIDSTETDIGGNYIFPLNVNGNYSIDAFSIAESGGVNSTDALGIAKHSVFLSTLTGLRLTAADVNAGQTVTAADALLVLHRTVGNISTFPAGDWVFEKKTFTLNGSNIGIDIYGLSTGDVNGSFIPYAKLENSVELQYSGILQLPPDESVWVPVYLSETTQTGALTIGLNFNADLIEVEGIQSSLPDLFYSVRDGEIRIAWSKTDGYLISRDIPMFEIWVKRKGGGVLNETPLFTSMNICEIAGPDEAVIPGRNLIMPKLLAAESLTGGFYLGQNRPNPAEESTTIPFMLPEEGMVTISLLNPVGSEINCLINTQLPAGSHSITTDCSHLAAGVYIYRLRFENGNTRYSQSRRMVISK